MSLQIDACLLTLTAIDVRLPSYDSRRVYMTIILARYQGIRRDDSAWASVDILISVKPFIGLGCRQCSRERRPFLHTD